MPTGHCDVERFVGCDMPPASAVPSLDPEHTQKKMADPLGRPSFLVSGAWRLIQFMLPAPTTAAADDAPYPDSRSE